MTHEEMDRLTAGMTSKAAKVRALNEAGVSTGDISRYLDIRYQHVYNVLLRAGAIEKSTPPKEARAAVLGGDGEIIIGRVNDAGAIELPAQIMERYGLIAGEPLYCRTLDDGLAVLSQQAARQAITQAAREKMPEQAALLEALIGGLTPPPPKAC
ncbi:hypothetical protein SAMN02927924_02633 [Sphingobium faniae]|uniref:hypothetical protein n=1 Tax=Sphingobium estronivorans TaxID=1577690 RepID=UPI0008762AFF|nr:hypothetical protein [Sphingobium estronivorans]SCW75846.1 hypothetical protein SAMN02927924_02633 [Sphingobium faniae]